MTSIFFNIVRICNSRFKCTYLKNEKLFLNFLFHFWSLHQILDISKKNMMVIGNVFRKLQTVKNFVTRLCKKGSFLLNTLRQLTRESVPNTCEISRRGLLSCFFINFKDVHSENISPSLR